jgi:acetyl esterase/lipase
MRILVALAALTVVQGRGTAEKKNPTFEEMIRMRIVASVPGMDAVSVRRDLVYKTAEGEPLHMDVYSPPGPIQPRPEVVLVHGGPIPKPGAKNMAIFVPYGELLAASGFAAVAFDHRFLAPARLSDANEDVANLLAQVRENAASLGVDPERVAVWAFSGGGPFLAALLRERPDWLRAVVAYYAILDLEEPPPGADSGLTADERERYSAIRGLGEDAKTAPPILVARAGLDHPWLNGGIDRFVQAAVAKGATLDLLNHPEGRHGFDILDDDARSKQIIRRTLDFLRESLTKKEVNSRAAAGSVAP